MKKIFSLILLISLVVWAGNPIIQDKLEPVQSGIASPPYTIEDWNLFSQKVIDLDVYRNQSDSKNPEILNPLKTAYTMLVQYYQANTGGDSTDYYIEFYNSKKHVIDSLLGQNN